jgi:NADH-quinone oxidoreductase subunit E
MLSPKNLQHLEQLKPRYQSPQSLVLEALWMWQDEHGWISHDGMKYVASLLRLPYHHVYGVATFYTMFNTKPVGRHKLEVCTNVSCMLRNCERLLSHIHQRIGIRPGETSSDGRFTLLEAECLGSCGTAPVMQVGDEYYENLDEQKLDRIMTELK